MKMNLRTEVLDYAKVLRSIGQDLAKLAPHCLELEVVENDFIVCGQGRGAQLRQTENTTPSVWRTLRKKVAHPASHQPAPLSYPFERKYTPNDVTRLDEAGIARARGPDKPPNVSELAEKLRMIGRIVTARCGRLTKVIDDMESVTVDYYDEQGDLRSEKYSMLALYKIQQAITASAALGSRRMSGAVSIAEIRPLLPSSASVRRIEGDGPSRAGAMATWFRP